MRAAPDVWPAAAESAETTTAEESSSEELPEDAEGLEPPPPQTTVTTLAELGLGLAGDLHGACLRGEVDEVDRMLRQGTDLLARERDADNGATPLHCACEHGHAEIVRMVLLAAPYSGVLLNVRAERRLKRAKRSQSEATGPAETPRELAARIGHERARMGQDIHDRWRHVLVTIDQFVEDERTAAKGLLGTGMTALSAGDTEGGLDAARECTRHHVALWQMLTASLRCRPGPAAGPGER